MRRLVLCLTLALFVLSVSAPPVAAKEGLKRLRRAIVSTPEAKRRVLLLPKLVANGEPGAAVLLGWLVEHDPALAIRIGAAHGLGRIRAENAGTILLEQILNGGPQALRDALADSFARTEDAAPRIVKAVDAPRRTKMERVLLLDAMRALKDDSTAERLRYYATSAYGAVCHAALRTLTLREDGGPELKALLGRRLAETRDEEQLRELLDVLPPVLDRTMQPALARLQAHEARDIAKTARILVAGIPQRAPLPPSPPKSAGDAGSRYAESEPPFRPTLDLPPPPTPDAYRQDIVVAFDATGSAHRLLPFVVRRAEREVRGRRERGISVRVGVVAFRGGQRRGAKARAIDVLSLTFDVEGALDYLRTVDARGTDDRGAAVAVGLRHGLDLMNWRASAKRRVLVFADSKCDDVPTALRRVRHHHVGDGTRTGFVYFLRTRTRVPEEYEQLAKAGGTRAPELLE